MQLTSTAFRNDSTLPTDYTCKGKGISPPLAINDVPSQAQSLALVMHDPDAIGGRDFLHWAVWDIAPDVKEIAEGDLPPRAHQGTNDYPGIGYGPACPPAGSGLHHYTFDLYALDARIELPDGTDRQTLESIIQDHTLTTATLVGTIQS